LAPRAAVDVCLNLRYPTAAETFGRRDFHDGIGNPVIFTSGEESPASPKRVPAPRNRPTEETVLADYIAG